MKHSAYFAVLTAAILFPAAGCNQANDAGSAASGDSTTTPADGDKFLLSMEPADARAVKAIRENAEDNEPVVVIGRIGGSTNPWVDGLAAFSIVDTGMKACNEIEGDQCPAPWDYCCEVDLPKNTLLVKVVDPSGELVEADARELLNVDELDTVVVRGVAHRDESGNVSVLADGIFVRRPPSTQESKS